MHNKKPSELFVLKVFYYGGVEGIRTLARV